MKIRIKPFSLVLGSITDRDNQGEGTVSDIEGLDNQAQKNLIISDNQAEDETCLIIMINDTT